MANAGFMLTLTIAAAVAAGAAGAQEATLTQISDPGDGRAAFDLPPVAAVPVAARRTLEWDPRRGRWGLSLGLQQRIDDGSVTRDVEPGLYYKVTPRLHIGGAVSLSNGDSSALPPRLEPQPPAPRVRLETTFKF